MTCQPKTQPPGDLKNIRRASPLLILVALVVLGSCDAVDDFGISQGPPNPCFSFPRDSVDYLPLIPHARWVYSYQRSDLGDGQRQWWNGEFELEILDVACGERQALYSVLRTYDVRRRLVIAIAGQDDYVETDTSAGEITLQLVEHPDGTVSGDLLRYLPLDIDGRYHSEAPDGFFTTSIGLEWYQSREQKYQSGVGLVESRTYPGPYLGFTSSSKITLSSWSIPDNVHVGDGPALERSLVTEQ